MDPKGGHMGALPNTRHRLLAMSVAAHTLLMLMIGAGAVVALDRNRPVTAGVAAVLACALNSSLALVRRLDL